MEKYEQVALSKTNKAWAQLVVSGVLAGFYRARRAVQPDDNGRRDAKSNISYSIHFGTHYGDPVRNRALYRELHVVFSYIHRHGK